MSSQSPWGDRATEFFYQLTPDLILASVEKSLGVKCTGRVLAHNSMENRVYEVELDLGQKQTSRAVYENYRIFKFYRPGRWTKEQILEEHKFCQKLVEEEIPVVAPEPFSDGETLHTLPDTEIHFACFPKVGGRAPDELNSEQVDRIGRLLARAHNVGASMRPEHRLHLNTRYYGEENLKFLLQENLIPPHFAAEYEDLARSIFRCSAPWFEEAKMIQIHGDCHLSNILWGKQGPFLLDFDDTLVGPAVQDMWLLLGGRDDYAKQKLSHLIRSYESMRAFDWGGLKLIEALRALRLIHFSAWIGKRWKDPIFQHYFEDYGSERYWRVQINDLRQQLQWLNDSHWWSS